MSTQEDGPARAAPSPPEVNDTTQDGCAGPAAAGMDDSLPLEAAASPVPPVAAVHLTGWWDVRPRRLQHPLLRRPLLEEAR